ncbi:Glu/Leu/Phe/Val dehydrogenase dimerization domain-containing protein [Streptomyces sp. NPDC001941]|uniref:Glu/Leu/Phe/Val dehydrogenase dimerization domain-containing protein n=1 Tax=Streptomyces sp. NPDC001941 TaxID=3154659 RepID=UPI003327421C
MENTLEFVDAVTNARGWLVYHDDAFTLSAGGCRMRAGLTSAELSTLAQRMSLKQRALGANVGGAKCGLDIDPAHPEAEAVLRRFLDTLRPELTTRYSMGPDMNTEWEQLSRLARQVDVPSLKIAVQKAQGLSEDDFQARLAILSAPLGRGPLGQRRAGHALAHAALAAADQAGITRPVRYALQGFGNLGQAVIASMRDAHAALVALGDETGCLYDSNGIDPGWLLTARRRTPVPELASMATRERGCEKLFSRQADVLILAGGADALTAEQARSAPYAAVVVGANYGLSQEAEDVLHSRGVIVVPDFIGGIGGPASMEALFGTPHIPDADEVLDRLARIMRGLIEDLVTTGRARGLTPTQAATYLALASTSDPHGRPYGHCRYLT